MSFPSYVQEEFLLVKEIRQNWPCFIHILWKCCPIGKNFPEKRVKNVQQLTTLANSVRQL